MKAALWLALTSLLASFPTDQAADRSRVATVTVRVVGFKHEKGKAMVALTTERRFLASTGALRAEASDIRNGEVICVFADVPYGSYAVQAFHDENGNGRLDRGLFGIPSEPYGFSNGARASFGPPNYEDAEFSVAAATVTLRLQVR